ncbi:hypothetical protein M9Y10_012168 [Tritrichomonas musculus]|uniref:DUF3447 domain-containing protein n=1 Tax=Tritrichomonas musculus TaxID=1915356 RepID=A0ABR2ICV3_9EUKA
MMILTRETFFNQYGKSLDEIIHLQDMIIQHNYANSSKPVPEIPKIFFSSKNEFMKLITTIQTALFTRYSNYNYYEKIIDQILPYINSYFNSDEIYYFSILNRIKLYFYRKGLITIDTVIRKAKASKVVANIFAYEIYQERPEDFNYFFQSKDQFLKENEFPSFDAFLEFRDKWINKDSISIVIREDNPDKLRDLISKNNISYDYKIPYSYFEDRLCFFKKKDMPNIIDYSALHGSIKIFKYLLMNDAKITDKTMEFAVYGGSYEIIHILENHKCSYSRALEASIRVHNNELYDYFINSIELHHTNDSISRAVTNYNIRIIKDILMDEELFSMIPDITDRSGSTLLGIAISQDFPDLIEMFMNIQKFDLSKPQESSFSYLMEACLTKNFDLVKFLIEKEKVDVNYYGGAGISIFIF